jgi:hypothetical protein
MRTTAMINRARSCGVSLRASSEVEQVVRQVEHGHARYDTRNATPQMTANHASGRAVAGKVRGTGCVYVDKNASLLSYFEDHPGDAPTHQGKPDLEFLFLRELPNRGNEQSERDEQRSLPRAVCHRDGGGRTGLELGSNFFGANSKKPCVCKTFFMGGTGLEMARSLID